MTEGNLTGPLVQSIGWALVHFVWQGALIAAAAAVVLALLRAARPTTRYAIACAALIVMCAAPVVTTLQLSLDADGPGSGLATSSGAPVATSARSVGGAASAAAGTSFVPTPSTLQYREYVERALPTAVFLWFAGVLVLSVRLATGWLCVQRLRTQSIGPLPEPLQARVAAFASRLRIARPVRVLESAIVAVPTLVGWLRPVILLPAAVVAAMPVAHLEAIIAHELAHVRRHDYLINAAAGRHRDAALLSPGGMVVFAPGADRARALLRRSCCRGVRRSRRLRHGARESRGTAARRAQVRAGGNRRAIAGPRAPRARRAARARWPLSHLVGQRCDCRRARAHRRAHHGGGRESERWYQPEWRRGSSGQQCAGPVERSCRVLAGIPALTAGLSRDFSAPRTAVGTGTAGRPGVARTSCRARASSASGRARAAGRPGTSDCSRCSGARRIARTSCTSRAC